MGDLGFWRLAEADGDRLALVDPDGGEHSAGALLARSNQAAHGLRGLGLEAGDTLAVLLPNGVELIELFLAALQVGVRITPINFHLVGPEVAYILADAEAKAFVAHERFAAVAVAAADEAGFPVDARYAVGAVAGFAPYGELFDGQPTTAPEGRTTGAAMHYTSGTTGRPKGVKRALAGIDPSDMAELMGYLPNLFGIAAHDGHVHLTVSPLYHTAVLMWTGNALSLGHTVVLMDKWSAPETLRLIETHGVTYSHMVPTQFVRLLELPPETRARYDMSSLRNMVHGAAPCPQEIKRRMIEWWGNTIQEYYAATEGGGTVISAEEWLERPGSVGRPWPGSEIRIYDDEQRLLGPGQIGTVYMSLMADFEYKGDPSKTRANRIDGYFTVGDLGELDADGYLFLRDRKSDMIISGGVNIYPTEIEGELINHPLVADVAVFGIPNRDWGEEIKAVVETPEGTDGSPEVETEILAWAATRMARFKLPRSVDFVAALPREPNGKLIKRRLRDPYWVDQTTQI
ncbi:acyl-CoA synthetase [Iamia sp.]|uniref:acyl-CoA synthetase n=1 Tax=Iamia sp. TaxID=2722710 RepID=UPI002C39AB53|nr:acyl-CoA synthetase [Iamia sp.]HXH56061.1 acyl-CoA synthetase [Iamia sp.]